MSRRIETLLTDASSKKREAVTAALFKLSKLAGVTGKEADQAIQGLVAEGADFNAADAYGITALMMAARIGNAIVVGALLKVKGIKVNQTNVNGSTALSLAAQDGCLGVVRVLLKAKGIDVNHRSKKGATPLILAAANGRDSTVQLLLKVKGIDLHAKDNRGYTALSAAESLQHEKAAALIRRALEAQRKPAPRSRTSPSTQEFCFSFSRAGR